MSNRQRFRPTFHQKLVSITLFTLLVLSGCGVSDSSTGQSTTATEQASIPTGQTSAPTIAIEPTYDWVAYEAGLNTNPTPTRNPEQATTYAGGLMSRTAEARLRATVEALPTPLPDDGRALETPWPTPTPIRGFYACEFVDRITDQAIISCWQGERNGEGLAVYAGGKAGYSRQDESARSGLSFCTKPVGAESDTCTETFWLPKAEGYLNIVAVTWPHITVESLVGTRYGFNADTLMWEEPQATLPTSTPTARPTNTPAPAITNAAARWSQAKAQPHARKRALACRSVPIAGGRG